MLRGGMFAARRASVLDSSARPQLDLGRVWLCPPSIGPEASGSRLRGGSRPPSGRPSPRHAASGRPSVLFLSEVDGSCPSKESRSKRRRAFACDGSRCVRRRQRGPAVKLADGSEFCANAPAHVSRKASSAAIADALVVRRGRSTSGRRLTQSRARRVVLRRRHRDSRLRSRSPLPRGIRPMLRAAAQVRRRPAPGSEVIPARSRDPVRAASTEGVTAVPPQQPPPDAARVRIVLRSATSCASRRARDLQRQAGSDPTTAPIDVAPVPEAPGRITRGGSAGSPLQSSATHFARIDSELTPAPRIGEHVVRDRPCNRRDRRDSRRCQSSCPKRDGAPPRTFQPSCPASAPSPF